MVSNAERKTENDPRQCCLWHVNTPPALAGGVFTQAAKAVKSSLYLAQAFCPGRREAHQLPTLSDGVLLRVRPASSAILLLWLPLPHARRIHRALPLSKTWAHASIVA